MTEAEVSLILSQMDPARNQPYQQQLQQQYNPDPISAISSNVNVPPLPPLHFLQRTTASPGARSLRRPRTTTLPTQTLLPEDEDGEESDGIDEEDEYFGEDLQDEDLAYGTPDDEFLGNSSVSMNAISALASGSASPNSGKAGKPRGRKPKSTFGTGLAKDSNEYQKLRKENHKNVEKKRRETINDGIKRLSGLIPAADKNKSKIINQAAEYIDALRANEMSNIEKWTLDKLMTEKTIRELTAENEDLKAGIDRRELQIAELRRMLSEISLHR